jgi:hypothetical protein
MRTQKIKCVCGIIVQERSKTLGLQPYRNIDMLLPLHYEIRNQATQRTAVLRVSNAVCITVSTRVQTQWNHELIAVMRAQC